jgi:nucleoside-triphosphatase
MKGFLGNIRLLVLGVVNLDKRILLLTGPPATGKTTVLAKIMVALNAKGYRVGGMISREIRKGNERVGFEIMDLTTSERGWLAHIDQKEGPKVGKYRVNLEDLDGIGVKAIIDSIGTCEVIAIDEIGPMELFSEPFKEAVRKALSSQRLVIAVLHWRAQDMLVREARNRDDSDAIIVTAENRENLAEILVEKAIAFLKRSILKSSR